MKPGETKTPSIRILGMHSRIVVMLIVALLPVFGFVIHASLNNREESLSQAASNLKTISELSALGTGRQVEGARQLLGVITSGPSLKGVGLNALCTEFLTNIRATYPSYANVGFLDADANVLCDTFRKSSSENFSDRAYFQRAIAAGSFAIGEYLVGRFTERPVITFSMPVYDNQSDLKGVAFAALGLEQLAVNLQVPFPSNVSVTLTDRKGTILGTDMLQSGRIGMPYPDAALYSAIKNLPSGITEARDSNGVDRLYSVTSVGGSSQPGLFVVASISREAVTAPASRELMIVIVLFTLWAALGMAAARWIGNKTLVLPARRLLSEINGFTGDDSAPALTPGENADEIDALSRAFHRLAGTLNLRQAERDSTEAQLREIQDRLLTAQRIGKIGNWEFDAATHQLWWSDQTYVICEQTPESFALTPKAMANQIFADDRERCAEARRNFAAGKAGLDIEYRIVTGKARVRWVHDLGEKRVDVHGRAVMSGTVQDITDRVRSERLLACEARALKALSLGLPLKTVLDELLLGLEAILPGALTSVNLFSPDGLRLRPVAGPSMPAGYNDAIDGLLIGPSAGSCGTAAYRREPVIVPDIQTDPLWADYCELAAQYGIRACWSLPVLDPAGHVLATFAVYYRHTHSPDPQELSLAHDAANVIGIAIQREIKDAALHASEERFRNTFAAAATGMMITTLEGRYIEVNQAYCRMFGYTAQELLGLNIFSFIHPEDRHKSSAQMQALKQGHLDSYISERRFVVKDSRILWIRSSVSALRDAHGKTIARAAIAEDITQQRQAEQALLKTQRLLSVASKISRQGAWQVDLPDHRLTWSDEVYAIHELAPGATRSFAEGISAYAPEYQDTIRTLFENCVSSGTPFDVELQIITASGRRVWVRALGEVVKDASGAIVQLQGALQDIDLQKQTELREKSMATRLATTLESISDAFFLLDHDWNFVFVNQQAVQTLGGGREDLLGKNLWQEYPHIVGTVAEECYRSAIAERQTKSFEWFSQIIQRWLEFRVYPTDEGLGVYFQDITQKRQAARQLLLLQTAVSHLNDMVIITDATGSVGSDSGIVFVNDAFERQTGYRQDEVIGKSPRILHGPHTQKAEVDHIVSSLEKGESIRAELIKYSKSGDEYWVEIETVPITDAHGSLTHYVAIERDVTERKQTEEKILQLNADLEDRVQQRTAQLEAANRELEAFSYSVSHDLRSPLNTINGFSQLLMKSNAGNLDTKGLHYLSRIGAGAQQMGKMIDSLLSLAKLSRESLKLETVDLSLMVRQIEHACRMREPGRQVQVVVQEGLVVQADVLLISVVMQNLIENAWKYSAKRDVASISVASQTQANGQTVYVIQDNGAGFDMAHADKLFGMFERLHSSADFEGTGLGLANVSRIIERHGGRIWAQGVPGVGATFYFTLSQAPHA